MSRKPWPPWLTAYLSRYRGDVAKALALGFAASACVALLMFTSGYLISATGLAITTLFSIMTPVACVQLFGFGRPLARYLERLASHDWVLKITSDLRVSLFRAIDARMGDPALERATGEYLGLLSDDVAHLQNLYLRVVFPTAVAYALAVGAAIAFGFFSVPFALVMALSFAVVAVLLPLCALLAARALVEREKALRADEFVALADDLYGATDWVLAGRGEVPASSHARADGRMREAGFKLRFRQRVAGTAATLALGGLLCAVVVWAGGRFGGQPGINEVNWIAAFALGFFPLIDAFAVLPAAFSESSTHREAAARLDEYLGSGASGQPGAPTGEVRVPDDAATAIRARDLSYTYPGGREPVLRGVDLVVPKGQTVAVLGRSGSGKTTFARLACAALQPSQGEMLVSGPVGSLGQVPYLFNRTLRANLLMGVTQATDEQLVWALEDVGLGGRFAELPRGLDTVIGETGVGFSGGEAHRIALARVLLADAPVVVVDEPFSALDPQTESALLHTMLRVLRGRTLVVVTHHLAHIHRFDRVVFLEGGRVTLDGAPSDLARSSPRFQALLAFDR